MRVAPGIDSFIERCNRMRSLGSANQRDISSLQNWINGNACIARKETAYLAHKIDLLNTCSVNDYALDRLEGLIEKSLMHFFKWFRKVSVSKMSSGSFFQRLMGHTEISHRGQIFKSHEIRTYIYTRARYSHGLPG